MYQDLKICTTPHLDLCSCRRPYKSHPDRVSFCWQTRVADFRTKHLEVLLQDIVDWQWFSDPTVAATSCKEVLVLPKQRPQKSRSAVTNSAPEKLFPNVLLGPHAYDH